MPQYSFHVSVEPTSDGKTQVKGMLTRIGVPNSWKDVVPVYTHMGDKTVRLGTLGALQANQPVEFIVPAKIDRVTINDSEDLLADVRQ